MGSYKLCWKESVQKDFRRLPSSIISRIIKKAESLPTNPTPLDSKKLKNTDHTYREESTIIGLFIRLIYQIKKL